MASSADDDSETGTSVSDLQGDNLQQVFSCLEVQALCAALQALVAANNVCSAWPVMDLASLGKCSTWKYNIPQCFYQCRLFALQYDPVSEEMRVSFEARGELDLKAACTSHMALVVDKPEHEYNPGGQMQPEAEDLLKAVPGRHHCTLSKDVRGHCQGVFVWGTHLLGAGTVAEGEHAFELDASLVFCYANPVTQPPNQYLEADYRCVELFKVPKGKLFTQTLKEHCTWFELPFQPEQRLQLQSERDRQALWHSSPYSLR